MISEPVATVTATVRAALDQRLQVGRTLAIDLVRPIGADPDTPRPGSSDAGFRAPRVAQGTTAVAFAARWPVGSTVAAQVTATADGDRVIADVDGLPLELHWRGDDGATPTAGQTLAFRVLAVRPEIVLQRIADAVTTSGGTADPDASPRISTDAQALQAAAVLAAYGAKDDRTIRFATPLLAHDPGPTSGLDDDLADATLPRAAAASPAAGLDVLALAARPPTDPTQPFAPILFFGPAWPDQPMELIVRRQRHDDRLDDPAQDDWCGELEIDLSRIGRVAGHLSWSMQGLRLRLDVDRETSATTLADAAPELAAAFIDVRLRVSALSIGHANLGPSPGGPDG